MTWNGPITDVPPISASRETLAVGTSGLVGFADEITAAGGNPVFWLTADGEGWTRESSPAIPATVHAVVGGCPTVPATMMEWLAIPGSVGAECFGEESITFTAWNTVGGGCGGYAPGIFEPGWLASPFAEFAIILTPFEAEYGGCGSATVHPDAGTLPDPQQWIQLTGHWDDPASEQCRVLPDPQIRAPRGASLTFECSVRFVVTGATEVDGP